MTKCKKKSTEINPQSILMNLFFQRGGRWRWKERRRKYEEPVQRHITGCVWQGHKGCLWCLGLSGALPGGRGGGALMPSLAASAGGTDSVRSRAPICREALACTESRYSGRIHAVSILLSSLCTPCSKRPRKSRPGCPKVICYPMAVTQNCNLLPIWS